MVRPEPHEDQSQNFSGSGLFSLSEAPPPDGLCLTCAQVKTFVDPVTNCVRYHTPRGRFLHVPPAGPRSDWDGDIGAPWWADHRYQVGLLSAKTRRIRVVNTLTLQVQPLQVGGLTRGILGKCVHPLELSDWVLVQSGVLRGDSGGDPAAVPALQLPRSQLHLETRRRGPGHEQDAERQPRPGPRPGPGAARAGPGPLHPRHPALLQR